MQNRYSLIAPTGHRLDRLRAIAENEDLSYTGVGASITGDHPAEYRWHSSERTVAADWEAARAAIRNWSGHRSVGGVLAPATPPLTQGATMAFGVRVLGVWATGTCRIVEVIDDDLDFGFSYGTLPHHPERGEEMFAARNNLDGTVTFSVAAFSKPAGLVTTTIGPIGRLIQRAMTKRYLEGFAAFAASPPAPTRR
ncbi:MAG TPA: DUF1990 domain-containing protein [Acidimicrobiia bacterium]